MTKDGYTFNPASKTVKVNVKAAETATTASVSGTLGQGTKNQEYNSQNTLTVTLTGGTFNEITDSKDGSKIAVEGLPSGLEYSVAATEDATEATITITGTPTEVVADKNLTIKVKEAALKTQTGVSGEITATGTVEITIVDSQNQQQQL